MRGLGRAVKLKLVAPQPPQPLPLSRGGERGAIPTSMRPWLLAALAALFVARPLVPSEAVAWLGDGQPFCMLWLLLGLATSLAAIKSGGFPRRCGAIEFLLCLFAALHSVAAVEGKNHLRIGLRPKGIAERLRFFAQLLK